MTRPADRRNPLLVDAVDLQAVIEQTRHLPLHHRRTRRQRRQDRQHQPDRSVQAGEFEIIGKGQVEMDALQVGPAVPLAAEYPVVGPVDRPVIVGPEPRLARGIHPGMHCRWHKQPSQRLEQAVDLSDLLGENRSQPGQGRHGAIGFEFNHMQRQLIRPAERPHLHLVHRFTGLGAQQAVGHRQDRERPAIDDHVFQLYAVALEEVQTPSSHSIATRAFPSGARCAAA